jgi:hypothetical protein
MAQPYSPDWLLDREQGEPSSGGTAPQAPDRRQAERRDQDRRQTPPIESPEASDALRNNAAARSEDSRSLKASALAVRNVTKVVRG